MVTFSIFRLFWTPSFPFYLRLKHAQKSVKSTPVWCNWEGEPSNWAVPLPSLEMMASGKVHASPSLFRFRNPSFLSRVLSIIISLCGPGFSTIPRSVQRSFVSSSLVWIQENFSLNFRVHFKVNSIAAPHSPPPPPPRAFLYL